MEACMHISCVVRSVPPSTMHMLIEVLADGERERFIALLVEYGYPVALALSRGVKMATGSRIIGYHSVDMTLRKPLVRRTNIPWTEKLTVPDVPVVSRLMHMAMLMGGQKEDVVDRLSYWMWIASQVAWFHHPIMMMDHDKASWCEYRHRTLEIHRDHMDY
jgi:hypothetical protein